MRVALTSFCCALVLVSTAGSATAAAADRRPGHAARLLAMFDFEETDDAGRPIGASYPMPVGWYPVGRDPLENDPNFLEQPIHHQLAELPGFPSYTEVGFAADHAASGTYSLRLKLDGGSAGAFVRTGVLPAVPESTYLLTARVRTQRIDGAAAVMRACYADGAGRRLPATVVHSGAVRTAGRWVDVSLPLDPAPKAAAWIVVEALLLQPTEQAALGVLPPTRHTPGDPVVADGIVLSDLDAEAWFDDVGLWQLPHVEVGTQHPWNVVRAPQRPEIHVSVRDLTGQRLSSRITLYDIDRRPVASESHPVGQGAPTQWLWTPELPGYGWYLADLQVFDEALASRPVARALSSLLWTPAEASDRQEQMHRLEVLARGMADEDVALLAPMLEHTGIAAATLAAWPADATVADMTAQQDRLAQTLDALALAGVRPSLAMSPIPAGAASILGVTREDAVTLLAAEEELWQRYVVPVLVRQGQQAEAWHIDALREPTAVLGTSAAGLSTMLDRFETYVPSPVLVTPASVYATPPSNLPRRTRVLLDVPTDVQGEHLADQLGSWSRFTPHLTAHLRTDPADGVSQRRRVAQLVLRMLQLREAGLESLAITSPWADAKTREPALVPDPVLGAFAGAGRRLVGGEVLGSMPMPDGLEARLIRRTDDRGTLAMWNRRAPADAASIALYLGERPVRYDVWGNAQALELSDGKHRLDLDAVPVFVEGIDLELARFRAAFQIDEPMIVSEQTEHRRVLSLSNPWPRTITGSLRFTGPEGWDVQPIRHPFSIPAGGTVRLPVDLSFPIHEVAGRKTLSAELDFVADRRYRVELFTHLTLGLPDIEFDASMVLQQPDGSAAGDSASRDAVVTCLITNTGNRPRSLYVFANLFDHPRQERVIPRLEPGETVIRRFRFPHARDELQRYPLRTGIREANGPAILNHRLDLADAR